MNHPKEVFEDDAGKWQGLFAVAGPIVSVYINPFPMNLVYLCLQLSLSLTLYLSLSLYWSSLGYCIQIYIESDTEQRKIPK